MSAWVDFVLCDHKGHNSLYVIYYNMDTIGLYYNRYLFVTLIRCPAGLEIMFGIESNNNSVMEHLSIRLCLSNVSVDSLYKDAEE